MRFTSAALRGVAIQRGRVGAARATFPTSAAALALARNPGPLAAAAAATALHPFAPAVYYDPFLAAHAATQDPNYRLQVRHEIPLIYRRKLSPVLCFRGASGNE
ncbi:uncharacterized protein LOC122532354 isoform X1 [Frieseomelitta varia]|uniref:uncharacterized protein LOC122532354 isoform X1 n=1 Tax=Frieseomelitta varia TaxID=561572 RepID=UPI001CB681FE|nr:uncharacterized protein LOC122532354 isoform X1 [Frieseomelitta varia]